MSTEIGLAPPGAAGCRARPHRHWLRRSCARAAEPIRIGLLLAKTGQIAPQTEYLAQGTYLALEERGNKIMGQPAELVWLDEPSPQGATQNMQKLVQENKVCAILGGSLSSNALAEEATAAQLKIPFVLRQRRGDRDHRQELQPLHVPAEHAGAGAIAHAGALRAELRQEVVFHHRVVRVRPGHPAVVARAAEAGRRHRGGHRRSAAEHRRLQLVHPEDPPGAAGRRAGRAVGRRSVHVPEAVERTWHEGEDSRSARSRSATPTSGRSVPRRRTASSPSCGGTTTRTTRRRRRRSPTPT